MSSPKQDDRQSQLQLASPPSEPGTEPVTALRKRTRWGEKCIITPGTLSQALAPGTSAGEVDSIDPKYERGICRDFIWGKCHLDTECRHRHKYDLESMKLVLKFCHNHQNTTGCSQPDCTYLHTTREEENSFLTMGQIPRVLLERYANMTAAKRAPSAERVVTPPHPLQPVPAPHVPGVPPHMIYEYYSQPPPPPTPTSTNKLHNGTCQSPMQAPQTHGPQANMQCPQVNMQGPQMDMQGHQMKMQDPQMDMQSPQMSTQDPQMDKQGHQKNMQDPQMDMQNPQKNMQDPQMDNQSPQMNMQSPQMDMQGHQMNMQDPQMPMQGPKLDMQSSQMNMQGPQMPMQGPKLDMQSPQMNMQDPQMDMQSPQMNMQGPQMPMQGPKLDMQSPQMNMQSPQMNMQGPQMNMQSPQMNMQGPQMNMQGPMLDMQSPQMNMQGPQMDMHSPQMNMEGLHMNMQRQQMNMLGPQMNVQGPQMNMQGPRMLMQGPQMNTQGPLMPPCMGTYMHMQGPQMPMQGPQMVMQGRQMPMLGPQMPMQGPPMPMQGPPMAMHSSQGPQMPMQGPQMLMQGPQMPMHGSHIPMQGPQMPMQGSHMPMQDPQMLMQGCQMVMQGSHMPIQGPHFYGPRVQEPAMHGSQMQSMTRFLQNTPNLPPPPPPPPAIGTVSNMMSPIYTEPMPSTSRASDNQPPHRHKFFGPSMNAPNADRRAMKRRNQDYTDAGPSKVRNTDSCNDSSCEKCVQRLLRCNVLSYQIEHQRTTHMASIEEYERKMNLLRSFFQPESTRSDRLIDNLQADSRASSSSLSRLLGEGVAPSTVTSRYNALAPPTPPQPAGAGGMRAYPDSLPGPSSRPYMENVNMPGPAPPPMGMPPYGERVSFPYAVDNSQTAPPRYPAPAAPRHYHPGFDNTAVPTAAPPPQHYMPGTYTTQAPLQQPAPLPYYGHAHYPPNTQIGTRKI